MSGPLTLIIPKGYKYIVPVQPWSNIRSPYVFCAYCGSGWNENKFRPGTCGNCGAPEDEGKHGHK